MYQRSPRLCFSFRISVFDHHLRETLIYHTEIKYFQEDVVREHFDFHYLAYFASNQPAVFQG